MTALLEILVEMRRLFKSAKYILGFWDEAQNEDGSPLKKDRARALIGLCRELRPVLETLLGTLTDIEERAGQIAAAAAPKVSQQPRRKP